LNYETQTPFLAPRASQDQAATETDLSGSEMNNEQLAAIRAREQKATEGPWEASLKDLENDDHVAIYSTHAEVALVMQGSSSEQGRNNSAFIANARTDIPALLDDNDRLRKALQECLVPIAALLFVEGSRDWRIKTHSLEMLDGLQKAHDLAFEALGGDPSKNPLSVGLGAQGEGEDAA
jgi:hypothetical protein